MPPQLLPRVLKLAPYVPGLSIEEIRQKYNLAQVIKLASNENPLGASPLAQKAIATHAAMAFRYPRGGNPRLARKLAEANDVGADRVIIGNGSDEIIDLLIRTLVDPEKHNLVCCRPCFSIYPIQGAICGVEVRRVPLNVDFSFDFASLLAAADANTRLVFLTTPDNPSGYCPPREEIVQFARKLAKKAPDALLVLDEAYMDFAEGGFPPVGTLPENVGVLRTFSKSYGLAGLRVGYAILPPAIADGLWRCRLPFSVNILAEEAALAALDDTAFREATISTVKSGRERISLGLQALSCAVCPSSANFIMFRLPDGHDAGQCFQYLLERGLIIRPLKSYDLPDHLRVSIGAPAENEAFLTAMASFLSREGKT